MHVLFMHIESDYIIMIQSSDFDLVLKIEFLMSIISTHFITR